jgi:DNA-binding response OmpR family regulator
MRTMDSPRRILIVDDNVDLAENIAEILQLDGHLTDVAGSAEEALEMTLGTDPDVVVTDYRLPGISGAVFIQRIRQKGNAFIAVVISAYTDDQTMREARDAGATFMAKPIDFKVLSQWIRTGPA